MSAGNRTYVSLVRDDRLDGIVPKKLFPDRESARSAVNWLMNSGNVELREFNDRFRVLSENTNSDM